MLSIGIPVYNEIEYIEKTLESVEKNINYITEIIISDNASTDGTADICKAFADKYSAKVRYVSQPQNSGIIKNFDYVLQNATSEWFMWLGAHDRLSDSFGEKICEAINKNDDEKVGMFYYDKIRLVKSANYWFAETTKNYVEKLDDDNDFERLYSFLYTMLNKRYPDSAIHSVFKTDISKKYHAELIANSKTLVAYDHLLVPYIIRDVKAVYINEMLQIMTTPPREELTWLTIMRRYKKMFKIKTSFVNTGKKYTDSLRKLLRSAENINNVDWEKELIPTVKRIYNAYNNTLDWFMRGYLPRVIVESLYKIASSNKIKRGKLGNFIDKNKIYMPLNSILNCWLDLKQNNISIADYFTNHKNIGVYGSGILFERLYQELKNSGINIKYFIDKNNPEDFNRVTGLIGEEEGLAKIKPILSIELKTIQDIDLIVVTNVIDFIEIKSEIEKITSIPVVSIEEIIFNLHNKRFGIE